MPELQTSDRLIMAVAALAGFLCVAGGAFGAHGLAGTVPAKDLAAFQTGMHYGQVHALAAFAALVAGPVTGLTFRWPAILFLGGILLFSGSLAFLGTTGSRALVLVTPLGGLLFLAGWAWLAAKLFAGATSGGSK